MRGDKSARLWGSPPGVSGPVPDKAALLSQVPTPHLEYV